MDLQRCNSKSNCNYWWTLCICEIISWPYDDWIIASSKPFHTKWKEKCTQINKFNEIILLRSYETPHEIYKFIVKFSLGKCKMFFFFSVTCQALPTYEAAKDAIDIEILAFCFRTNRDASNKTYLPIVIELFVYNVCTRTMCIHHSKSTCAPHTVNVMKSEIILFYQQIQTL